MRKRILQYSILLWATAMVTAVVVASFLLQWNETASMTDHLRDISLSIAQNMHPVEDYQQEATALSWKTGGQRVTLVAEDGTLLGDSHMGAAAAEEGDLLSLEEFRQANSEPVGFADRVYGGPGGHMLFAASKSPYGFYVRIGEAYSGFWGDLLFFLPALLAGVCAALLLVIPGTVWISRSIIGPIQDFSMGLTRVMHGGARLDVPSYPYPELRKIAQHINDLSAEVRDSIARVENEHNKLDTLLSNMKEGFVMVDDDGLLLINDTACQVFGCERLPVGARLMDATGNPLLLEAVKDVKQTGVVRRVEMESADGGVFEATVGTTRTQPGQSLRGVMILLSDITDKRSAEKVRQGFFQSASHELKTPITSIRGFAELLATNVPMDEDKRRECAERINKEATRMQILIDDILKISRLESGEVTYERKDIDLLDVVQELCDDAQKAAADNQVDIRLEGESCPIHGSPRELEELVGNLITNALKYNRPGGTVEVKLYKTGGGITLSVFNTGDVIPPESVRQIFERFYRLDKGRSKAVGGTGLGLAIVKHIAGSYDAKVRVMPHPGIGNTFFVDFPASEPLRKSS